MLWRQSVSCRRVRCSVRASGGELGDGAELSFSLGGGAPWSRPFSWSLRGLYVVHNSRFRGLNVVYGMNGIVLWCTFLHFHLLSLPTQIRRNPQARKGLGVSFQWSRRELNPGPSPPRQGFSVRSSHNVSARPSGSGEHVRMTGPVSEECPFQGPTDRAGRQVP